MLPWKTFSGATLTLVLMSTFVLAFRVHPVRANMTIYIFADGSVEPPSAPLERDGDVYVLTGDIYGSIIVERDSIMIDGKMHLLQGVGNGTGMELAGTRYVSIKNIRIMSFTTGIFLGDCSNNTVSGNEITSPAGDCIFLSGSSYNNICGNSMTNGWDGIYLQSSSINNISGNNLVANKYFGIWLSDSWYNSISRNNIGNSYFGIVLANSSRVTCQLNNLTSNGSGVWLDVSSNNDIRMNNVADNIYSIRLSDSPLNNITGNTLRNSEHGSFLLDFSFSSNNTIYHNSFFGIHVDQINIISSVNSWYHAYEGNYWSDYTGNDLNHSTCSLGIGDTPYVVDETISDNYPLMSPYMFGDVNHDAKVNILDISIIGRAYGTQVGEGMWNPHADLDENNKINIIDISGAAKEFGKQWKDA